MSLPRLLRCGLAVATVLQAAPASPPGEVIELPPMIVEWKNAPLRWRYLGWPGYEIISVCSDRKTVDYAQRSHRLGELLSVLVPDRFQFKSVLPESHILFNEVIGRAQSKEVIAEMVRKQGAQVVANGTILAPVVSDTPAIEIRTRYSTIQIPERQIHFMPNMRLWDLDTLTVFAILPETATSSDFTFTEGRVQSLLLLRTPALPDWFVEGTMEVYRKMQVFQNYVSIKPAEWLSGPEAILPDPKPPGVLMPMPEMLAYRHPGNAPVNSDEDRIWQAQSALFVRWALADKTGARREALWKFVDRLEHEPPTESLFQECLGLSFENMQTQLSEYLPEAVKKTIDLKGPKTVKLPKLKMRPATDLEIARIRGDWERLEIDHVRRRYPELAEKYVEQALTTLRRPYAAGEQDPRLLALLGLTELEAGDPVTARGFLEAAVRGGVIRPRANLELALLRYADLPAEGQLTADQVRTVAEPLQNIRGLAPPLFEAFALLTKVWSRSAEPPDAETLAQLNEGAGYFPRASSFMMRVVYFNLLAGNVSTARALTESGLRESRLPEQQERFTLVLKELAAQGY